MHELKLIYLKVILMLEIKQASQQSRNLQKEMRIRAYHGGGEGRNVFYRENLL